ncbi:hypothetical protein Tco_0223766 [Tanacetum coccineum]
MADVAALLLFTNQIEPNVPRHLGEPRHFGEACAYRVNTVDFLFNLIIVASKVSWRGLRLIGLSLIEEDPQEDEDDMEIKIEEDKNEPKLTYPYEKLDPLNPPPPASKSEPDNEIEVENLIEHEDETVPVSVYEDIDSLFGRMVNFLRRLCGRETTYALVEKKGEAKDRFYGKLILDLGNEVRSSVEQGTVAMEKLVEKLGIVKEKAECKTLKKELEEARLNNTFLRMQNERVERYLYWTRVRAHEFYQEMIRRGFMFEERPNEAIDVSIKDEKSPLSEPRGSPPDV